MNCKKCSYQLTTGDKFCQKCGNPVEVIENNNLEHTILNLDPVIITNQEKGTELEMPLPAFTPNLMASDPIENQKVDTQMPHQSTEISQEVPTVNKPLSTMGAESIQNSNLTEASIFQDMQTETIIPKEVPIPASVPTPRHVESTPTNTNITLLIIGIAVVIVFALGGFFIGKSINKENVDTPNTNENNNNSNSNNTNTNNDNPIPTPTASNYKVSYRNFDLNIPVDYEYQIQDDILIVHNSALTWIAEITIEEIMYANIVTGKEEIKNYFNTSGLVVGNYAEKRYGSATYLTFEITKELDKYIFAYTQANSRYTFGIAAYNKANTIEYDILSNISTIVSSATFVDRSKNSSIDSKVTLPSINQVIK